LRDILFIGSVLLSSCTTVQKLDKVDMGDGVVCYHWVKVAKFSNLELSNRIISDSNSCVKK